MSKKPKEKLSRELKNKILHNMFVKNYKRMWPYIKPYWFRGVLSLLLAMPIGAMDAVIAMALKPYMDLVMVEKSVQTAWYIPLVIIIFTVAQGILTYVANYLNTWSGAKITNGLKLSLYKKMLFFETEFFNKKNSGDVIFMFNNNADMACAGLLTNLKNLVQKLFTAISLIFVLFYNSWQLALICVTVLVGALLPMTTLKKKVNEVITTKSLSDDIINNTIAYTESAINSIDVQTNAKIVGNFNLHIEENNSNIYMYNQYVISVFESRGIAITYDGVNFAMDTKWLEDNKD